MKTVGDFSKTSFKDFVSAIADELASHRNLPLLTKQISAEILKQENQKKEQDRLIQEREDKFGSPPKWVDFEGKVLVKNCVYFLAGFFMFEGISLRPGQELLYLGQNSITDGKRITVSFRASFEKKHSWQVNPMCDFSFASYATESVVHGTVVLPVVTDLSALKNIDSECFLKAKPPCAAFCLTNRDEHEENRLGGEAA